MPSSPTATNANAYSWVGTTNGLWGSASNWFDTTSGLNPAAFIPGALTPVWIINAGASAVTIQGGGTASSAGILGGVTLAGTYGVTGTVTVGTLVAGQAPSLSPGALGVASAGSLGAAALNVPAGSVTLNASSTVAVTSGLTIGLDGGTNVANNGTYAYVPSTAGLVNVQSGATLAAGGGLFVNAGTLSVVGGTATITGGLTVGSAGTVVSQLPLNTAEAALGRVIASSGGTVVAQGNAVLPDGMLVADGTASTLVVGGTVTASLGGVYTYFTSQFPSTSPGLMVAVNGGGIRVGGLVLTTPALAPFGDTVVSADGASSIEVGAAGNAAAGALTIDAGRTVLATSNAGIYANLVDNGTLIVSGGSVTQSGSVSGTGSVQIGRNGTWVLDGAISNTVSINFTDIGAALAVGPDVSLSGVTVSAVTNTVPAVISGFQAGDAIMLSETVTAASFTAGTGGNPGTLTLSNNGTVSEQFLLSGSFTGQTFSLGMGGNGWAVVGLTAAPASVPQSITRNSYVWTGGPAAGGWQTAANWRDATAVNQATVAPGALTPVTLAGLFNAPAQAITGGGTAASLGVTGAFGLSGNYGIGGTVTVGTLVVGQGSMGASTTLLPAVLTLFSGGTLTTPAINLINGTIALGAGAAVTASGGVTIGTAGGQNVANNGTYLANAGAAGVLSLATGATLSTSGSVALNAGTLMNTGGVAMLGRGVVIGSAGTGSASASYSVATAPGYLVAGSGGTVAVTGGVSVLNGIAVADGLGATLTASAQLSAVGSGTYTSAGNLSLNSTTASLAALNGGFVQVTGVILSGSSAAPLGIVVDNASTLEIGTTGSAAKGALTIDAARSLTTNGTVFLSDTLINNGSLVLSSGTLVQTGAMSGTGLVRIGNGTLTVNGTVAAGGTISFGNTAAVLALGDSGLTTGLFGVPYPFGDVLSGFQTGNVILSPGSITSASYNAGTAASTGTLTLRAGTAVVESLLLAGVYTQRSFSVTPVGTGTAIGLVSDAATVGIESLGSGRLTQAGTVWTLDLGSVPLGSPVVTGTIGIMNLSSGQVGALRGAFTLSGPSNYTNSGFSGGFSGVAAGQEEHQQTITLATTGTGLFVETIVAGASSVSLSDTVILPSQTIIVRGTVQPSGLIYTLPTSPTTIVAGAGNDTFSVIAGALNSHDSLDGGGGVNTIRLVGGGVFDLGAPKLIANIQSVTATEGTSAMPIIDMRDGTGLTVNLSPAQGGGGSAILYGGTGADIFNLSSGSDTVVLGSVNDVVIAGGGTALVQAPIGLAGAVITGRTIGLTTLEITTGGTATLAAADMQLTVSLDAAANLSLGTAQFITAIGSASGDTIIAGAAGQTLVGGGGNDQLIGSTGFGDVFMDSSTGLSGDTIVNFGGSDVIDITDLAFGSVSGPTIGGLGTITTLGLSDGIHNTTITLLGSYTAANFSLGADSLGHVAVSFAGP